MTAAAPRPLRVTIGVLTFRRPAELAGLLPLLLAQAAENSRPDVRVDVLVVDNDPAGTAREVVADAAHPGGAAAGRAAVRYVVEERPGIAAARNRVLDEVADSDVLVFIDDDERPHAGWLRHLLDTRAACGGATGVVGPVVSAFDGELDPWVAAGDFFRRRRLPTGTQVSVAATNNLLLDMAAVRSGGLRFEDRFGLAGGSDTLFTRQLVARGGALVWCDEALVTDHVPAGRMTREWVVRRAFRSGNSSCLVDVDLARSGWGRLRARLRAVVHGSVRLAGGSARWAAGAAGRSTAHRARGVRTAARGAGMLAAAAGVVYREYRRPVRTG